MSEKVDAIKRLEITVKRLAKLLDPIKELLYGIRFLHIPPICSGLVVVLAVLVAFKIDRFLIEKTKFSALYPYYPLAYKIYVFSLVSLPLWLWAWNQVRLKQLKLKELTAAFRNAGLQSTMGRLPYLVSDQMIDSMTRKLRLTNAGFPVSKFREQAKYIESELGIFIDDIKENREKRMVEVIYSHYPLKDEVEYTPDSFSGKSFEFLVGETRANKLISSLRDSPHLLVAGQTGGGKSTFLRQFIVHFYLQNKQCQFLLIDLKGGLEFSLFEKRKRFTVVPHVMAAVDELKKIDGVITDRMSLLKENQCKDIETYFKKNDKTSAKVSLYRLIIVIDEAAEMFLAGHHAKAKEIQSAKEILSKIARQGRALGIHLVVATQRPDARSLDPQIKANLTGVICFQMMNDASSIAVIGNGRATDLPKIPGRAIWKSGMDLIEVQTPLLTIEGAEALLGKTDDNDKVEDKSNGKEKSNIKPSDLQKDI